MKIYLKVIPNSKQSEVVDDYYDILENRNIKIKVNQPPENNKANHAVIEILSKYLNIKKSQISIKSGQTSTKKIIEIQNII